MKPIAIVIPWYGDDIRGGAEQESNYLAHSISAAGQPVEVFTTCVKDAASDRGKNTMKAGVYNESGITVRRFAVREDRDLDGYNESNLRIYRNEKFTPHDEEVYFKEDINSPDMYRYISEHADDYRTFLFIPYMYGIIFNGSEAVADKSVLIPCLHDESYAYMDILRSKMNSFKGMIFLSEPEGKLAKRLYGLKETKKKVLGAGLDTDWYNDCDAEAFRKKYGIDDDFILFAGRKDLGKKADELITFFLKYKEAYPQSSLKLVLLGGGELPVQIPDKNKEDVIDLGFVSIEDKHNAFAACTIFCNPSYFESFSIVIMEAWLAKRPVLVSEHCAVTANFARVTNGGLWYNNYEEFEACVKFLLDNKDVCKKMGENGFEYVLSNFTHEKIAENYLGFISELGL
ncbi:MAG: glycosyltransferase family 4 protein [Oscillospiraceae bacterium]|nr:glycosyltransferase family 4 protein [Oscillospiraceae bacterium]